MRQDRERTSTSLTKEIGQTVPSVGDIQPIARKTFPSPSGRGGMLTDVEEDDFDLVEITGHCPFELERLGGGEPNVYFLCRQIVLCQKDGKGKLRGKNFFPRRCFFFLKFFFFVHEMQMRWARLNKAVKA